MFTYYNRTPNYNIITCTATIVGRKLVSTPPTPQKCYRRTSPDLTQDLLGFRVWINSSINLLKPNDIYIYIYIYIYICRTAALTSRRYILNIYSTNIHTEYFKHAA